MESKSTEKFSQRQAQETMLLLLKGAHRLIDICASSQSTPLARLRAKQRLHRAIAAVTEKK